MTDPARETVLAPAKLNLCLFLGPARTDGMHELCSVFVPITLADRITIAEAAGPGDEVHCPGIQPPDLTARALVALREAGWRRAPLRIEVDKLIPVAAGLGGGSADAAAILRQATGDLGSAGELERIAATLGADVPSQLDPRFALVGGAGERVTPLPEPEPFSVVLLPDGEGLSTADVYAEADRLGLARPAEELTHLAGELLGATAAGGSPLGYRHLLVNDLAQAARSLRPSVGVALEALEGAGADLALVTGSGPTAVGLFADDARASDAASALEAAGWQAIAARSGINSL